jgi:hypothetical protein
MDEAGGKEQRAPASIPGQRDIEALPDHAMKNSAESGPRVHRLTQQGHLGELLPELEEAHGCGDEGTAAVRGQTTPFCRRRSGF